MNAVKAVCDGHCIDVLSQFQLTMNYDAFGKLSLAVEKEDD